MGELSNFIWEGLASSALYFLLVIQPPCPLPSTHFQHCQHPIGLVLAGRHQHQIDSTLSLDTNTTTLSFIIDIDYWIRLSRPPPAPNYPLPAPN